MMYIHSLKSNWHYVVLVASVIQFSIIIYQNQSDTINPDARSAIARAKTQSCKKELKHFATNILSRYNQIEHYPQLRTCKLDSNKQRNLRVGCASNSTHDIIKLDEQVSNSSICLDLCFSYGHSHGGYDAKQKNCFCGDTRPLLRANEQSNNCYGHDEFDWHQVNNGIYYANRSHRADYQTEGPNKNVTQVRIAFLLILNGRSVIHIRRLLKNIYSKEHIYYLHVDKRNHYLFNELLDLETTYSNVHLATSRFNTIWGSPSLLRMIVDAIGHLSQYKWDYLINLSESDFPIKPIKELETYLGRSPTKWIYLKSHNIKGYKFIKKQGLEKDFYQCEDRVWRMGNRKLPRGIVYSGGSDWFVLPKDFCLYILDNLGNSKTLVKPLMRLFNYTLLPAESFFHTLASNSEFCDRLLDSNLRITNWHRKQSCKCQHNDIVDWCGCSPLVYRWSDLGKLQKAILSSNIFFTRKFDPTISSSIINTVESSVLGHNSSEDDTRFWQTIYKADNHTKNLEQNLVLEQFGLFSLRQLVNSLFLEQAELPKLKSIDLYFNNDRFVGFLHHYCINSTCLQFLVEKRNDIHVFNHNNKCFDSGEHQLKVIEVNHGFDTGERMFSNHQPLSHLSDIVVYHEWLVDPFKQKIPKNATESLQFNWVDPQNRLESVQNVKLKGSKKHIRLSLAHRFNARKPFVPGLWTLAISYRNRNCLDYKFLIFDHRSFTENKIDQRLFNKFYQVSKMCLDDDSIEDDACTGSDWSLLSRI